MARKFVFAFLLILSIFLLGSCTSFSYRQSLENIREVVGFINDGNYRKLEIYSQKPFLFDGEIVVLRKDVAMLWQNIAESGFTMGKTRIAENVLLTDDTWKMFGNTMDVEVFFQKYTDMNTSIVTLNTEAGNYYLLLGKPLRGISRIIGLKGPVK